MDLLPHNILAQLLQRLGISQEASEYHGALCGMLCHGDYQSQSLIFDEMKDDADALQQLMAFTRSVLGELQSPEFMPTLPEDDQPLAMRVEALATWCAGFLYGLGTSKQLEIASLSEESQELLRDLTEISRASAAQDDTESEEDERAYAELVEYVRVGAQVIFLELHPKPEADSAVSEAEQPTLH